MPRILSFSRGRRNAVAMSFFVFPPSAWGFGQGCYCSVPSPLGEGLDEGHFFVLHLRGNGVSAWRDHTIARMAYSSHGDEPFSLQFETARPGIEG